MDLLQYLENVIGDSIKNHQPPDVTVNSNIICVRLPNNESVRCHIYSDQGVIIFAKRRVSMVSFETIKQKAPIIHSILSVQRKSYKNGVV